MILGLALTLLAVLGWYLLSAAAAALFGPVAWYISGGLLCFVVVGLILGRVGMGEVVTDGLHQSLRISPRTADRIKSLTRARWIRWKIGLNSLLIERFRRIWSAKD